MNDLIKIENLGYTANNNPSRAIRSGAEFEEILPAPNWQEEVVKRNADVSQTVREMQILIKKSAWQTKELSRRLLGKDTYTTCKNIWHFLFEHCKYKEDDEGQEQLRTPALSWYLRTIRGIDCDDFSIFASTILYNLGIPHYLRIAKYSKDYFQHVYVVVPQTNKKYITVDAVLDQYDAEKEPTEIKDFIVMDTNKLNGIDVTVLSGIEDEAFNELQGILSGVDFDRLNELEGLGTIPPEDEVLGAIYNHLVRTRDFTRKYPHYIKQVENPDTFLGMLDYAIGYWDTDKREEALGILVDKEEELNGLHGLADKPNGYEEAQVFYGIEGIDSMSGLGKVKAKRGFFKKLKEVAQKAKQGIKKVGKALIRFNPVTIGIRGGVLLAMKTNFLKLAEKIKWGYLTEAEARSNGFDVGEWQNAKIQLQKIEKLFVNILQGKPEALKKAILTGRAGKLNGINGFEDEALGVVVAAATGASITTAMPFIKKIIDLAKKINFKKLVAKVNPAKLMRGKKKAEQENTETDSNQKNDENENATALPDTNSENNSENNSATTKTTTDSNEENTNGQSTGKKSSGGGSSSSENANQENNSHSENEAETENKNLPATQKTSSSATTEKAEGSNPLTKVIDWVKENPGKTALIAGILILAVSSTARKSVGIGKTNKRGKKRKGNTKNHPPKTVSGLKALPKPRNKPKGKGGHTPTVTL